MKKNLLLLTLCISVLGSNAQTLSVGKPEDVGMSSERLARMDAVINDAIAKKWFPGVAVMVVRNGKIVYNKAYGVNDTETNSPLKKDAIFRIASQTKAITSTAVMMLYEEGKIGLDDAVSKFIPEFKNLKILSSFNPKDSSYTSKPYAGEMTIRQLLTHTSGIDYALIGSREFQAIYAKAKIPVGLDKPFETLGPKMKILGTLPLKQAPGATWTYSLSIDVLGYVVEVASGMSLDQFLHQRLFEPLDMKDTYFYLPKEKQDRLVVAYADGKDGVTKLRPGTGLDPTYPNVAGSYYSGGAGLTSTLEDYAKFLQMFINNGKYNGHQVLGRKTVELMLTCQTPAMEMQFGLGFQLETQKNDANSIASVGSFTWGGAFSTSYWGDPKEKLVALIYEQVLFSQHSDLNKQFQSFVYQAITD